MKNIAILVPDGAVAQGVADPRYLFDAANNFLVQKGEEPYFNTSLVGEKPTVSIQDGAFQATTDVLLSHDYIADLVVVPPIYGDVESGIDRNRNLIPWIVEQRRLGAEIASLCLGAFILAETGLLDNRECSTHWDFGHLLVSKYPSIKYADGKIICESDGIYSSGGANSYWNLLLYLLEKYTDREMAVLTAKYFAIDISRNSQSFLTIFRGQKTHKDETILKVQDYLELNFRDRINIDHLSAQFNIGKRTLERRFKKATFNTINLYLQRVRIEVAKKAIETTNHTIQEIMYKSGYNDPKSFRNVFQKITGISPKSYILKYR